MANLLSFNIVNHSRSEPDRYSMSLAQQDLVLFAYLQYSCRDLSINLRQTYQEWSHLYSSQKI